MTHYAPGDDLFSFPGLQHHWLVRMNRPWTLEEIRDPNSGIVGSSACSDYECEAASKGEAIDAAEKAMPGWSATSASNRAEMARRSLLWLLAPMDLEP